MPLQMDPNSIAFVAGSEDLVKQETGSRFTKAVSAEDFKRSLSTAKRINSLTAQRTTVHDSTVHGRGRPKISGALSSIEVAFFGHDLEGSLERFQSDLQIFGIVGR